MKPTSSKSFDLEERIHDCWGVVNDLSTLNRAVCDKGLSEDQIANILIGMIDLYSLKFDELFECFSVLHSDVCAVENAKPAVEQKSVHMPSMIDAYGVS